MFDQRFTGRLYQHNVTTTVRIGNLGFVSQLRHTSLWMWYLFARMTVSGFLRIFRCPLLSCTCLWVCALWNMNVCLCCLYACSWRYIWRPIKWCSFVCLSVCKARVQIYLQERMSMKCAATRIQTFAHTFIISPVDTITQKKIICCKILPQSPDLTWAIYS